MKGKNMNIGKYLCEKYRAKIENDEVIDLDELATEMQGLDLKDICPELAEYLESINGN